MNNNIIQMIHKNYLKEKPIFQIIYVYSKVHMYLKNDLMDKNIYNGTIGIVIDVNLETLEVRIAFSVKGGIVDIGIKRETVTFTIDGKPSSRCQFPLQNAFALTVHKTQGLSLLEICLSLDNQIFSAGQAYVALSRCSDWSKVHISS